ncbi:MAG TPA: phosphotransferase, partial [Candidatus Baltobacteraceae bacterium]|nr:phosphotransferase [Candidatus Baltobacteraceae bacterium]
VPREACGVTEPWAADVDVTVDLARALIVQRFPELSSEPVEPLGEGWDNAAFLVGGEYVFRFPRRAIAAPLIAREIAILPLLAPHLPIAISEPCFAGGPAQTYPWQFAGYRSFPGRSLAATPLSAESYLRLAKALGTFLRALHGIDAQAAIAAGLGGDEIGRLDHSVRMPKLKARFAELQAEKLLEDPKPYLDFLDAVAPRGPRPERSAILHGDLYATHVMVEADGTVAGVIDWGDLHLGDPAVDVSIVFELLPEPARERFIAAYGAIDDRTWELARYRAIYHAALVAHYGHRIGNEELLRAGLTGLQYAAP